MDTQISNRQSVIQIVKAASSDIMTTLGGDTFSFALGLMLLHTTHSAMSFGLGSIIYPLVGLLLVIPVGNLVDHRPHRPLILGSKLAGILAFALYALLVPWLSMPMLLAVMMLTIVACCDKVTTTAFTAAVRELVNPAHIKTLATIEQAATATIQLVSPIIAAALYAWIGFAGIVWIELGMEIISTLIVLTMRFHPVTRLLADDHAKSQWQQFRVGLRYIRDRFTLRTIVLVGILLNFLFSSIDIGLPYAIVQTRHLSSAQLSWVLSAFAAGILLGNLLLMVLPTFKRILRLVLGLGAVIGLLIVLLGSAFLSALNGQWLIGILIGWSLLVGIVLAFINTPMSVYMQLTVPTELLGRVDATFSTLMQLALPLGTLVYGSLFQACAAGPVYLVTGLVIIGYLSYNMWRVHHSVATKQIGNDE